MKNILNPNIISPKKRAQFFLSSFFFPVLVVFQSIQAGPSDTVWNQLFNGVDLDDWVFHFAGHELGVIPLDVVFVEDSIMHSIQSPHDFALTSFGHYSYKDELFSHYLLAIEYKFHSAQAEGEGTRDGQFNNSGVMLHSQKMEDMGINSSFPTSIEMQFLGDKNCQQNKDESYCPGSPGSVYEPGQGRTGNLATPGTYVFMDGQEWKNHLTFADLVGVNDSEWVRVEALVLGGEMVQHFVKGQVVMEYTDVRLDNGDPLTEGVIALQSESSDVSFRKVEMVNFVGCMDEAANNFKDYHIVEDNSQCDYEVSAMELELQSELKYEGNTLQFLKPGVHSLEVLDTRGKVVYSNQDSNQGVYHLNQLIKPGIYFLKVQTGARELSKKILVM